MLYLLKAQYRIYIYIYIQIYYVAYTKYNNMYIIYLSIIYFAMLYTLYIFTSLYWCLIRGFYPPGTLLQLDEPGQTWGRLGTPRLLLWGWSNWPACGPSRVQISLLWHKAPPAWETIGIPEKVRAPKEIQIRFQWRSWIRVSNLRLVHFHFVFFNGSLTSNAPFAWTNHRSPG